jgi:UDP-2-acetamido-2,6-beta-L-arabino-hexul-4-ose reductase
MLKKIGITGSNGFIGYHLIQAFKLKHEEFEIIEFNREMFNHELELDDFVKKCDVIIHLAAINRHENADFIYETNILLVNKLICALERTLSKAHVIVSSSTHEITDNLYGKSKKEGRILLSKWANKSGGSFTGLIIPNVFGPFGKPFYNSVVSTFCHQIARNIIPKIDVDGELKLIYVGDLVESIIELIHQKNNLHELYLPSNAEIKVSEILRLLQYFSSSYQVKFEIPSLNNDFETKLFNTFRCYMDISSYFPRKFVKHADNRGEFIEIARLGISGQASFSTTLPGVTRGNHFHTRKIERFAVIRGKALIQLRRIGTEEVFDFYLDGDEPAFVDMPIWFTHNIKNIGEELLYTFFWINEPFDANNPDTYFEIV